MFFSSPSADLKIIIIALIIALIISVIAYLFSKKIIAGVFLMSILCNIILYVGLDYNLAKIYNISLLFKFASTYWPYINLLLLAFIVFNYFKNKNVKIKKN